MKTTQNLRKSLYKVLSSEGQQLSQNNKRKLLLCSQSCNFGNRVVFGMESRLQIQKGVDLLGQAVGTTLGPGGRNVILQVPPSHESDGVTVARSIQLLPQILPTLGAKLISDASDRTNSECGDGTTTSTIIAQGILQEGVKALQYGKLNPVELRKGIQKSVQTICQEIDKMTSAIAEIHARVGGEGTISIQEGHGQQRIEVNYLEGYSINSGYLSPYFASSNLKGGSSKKKGANDKMIEFENGVYVVTIDQTITYARQLLPFLEFAKKTQKPLVIIASEFEAEPLTNLVINKLQNNLKIVAVKAPIQDINYLEDIAVLTGATLLSAELGYNQLERVDPVYVMGKCEKVQIDMEEDILLGDFDKEKFMERIAKFKGGIAIIKAAGRSEVEMNENRDRIEDAVHAVRAAIEDGVVIGGGCALMYAANKCLYGLELSNYDQSVDIVLKVSSIPLLKIYQNANILNSSEGGYIRDKLLSMKDERLGYDGKAREICNLLERNIIDPAKVVKSALKNGAGVASILLTADCAIIQDNHISSKGNLNDFRHQLRSRYSNKELEAFFYSELKSHAFENFVEVFSKQEEEQEQIDEAEVNTLQDANEAAQDIKSQSSADLNKEETLKVSSKYPKIEIDYCSPLRRNFLVKNASVLYDFNSNTLKVCRNHIHSYQILKEDFRRENQLAYDFIIEKRNIQNDIDQLAQTFIRACHAEYQASEASPRNQQKLEDSAVMRCANHHLRKNIDTEEKKQAPISGIKAQELKSKNSLQTQSNQTSQPIQQYPYYQTYPQQAYYANWYYPQGFMNYQTPLQYQQYYQMMPTNNYYSNYYQAQNYSQPSQIQSTQNKPQVKEVRKLGNNLNLQRYRKRIMNDLGYSEEEYKQIQSAFQDFRSFKDWLDEQYIKKQNSSMKSKQTQNESASDQSGDLNIKSDKSVDNNSDNQNVSLSKKKREQKQLFKKLERLEKQLKEQNMLKEQRIREMEEEKEQFMKKLKEKQDTCKFMFDNLDVIQSVVLQSDGDKEKLRENIKEKLRHLHEKLTVDQTDTQDKSQQAEGSAKDRLLQTIQKYMNYQEQNEDQQ